MRHSNVEEPSLEVKVKSASAELLGSLGCAVIVVFGAAASIVQVMRLESAELPDVFFEIYVVDAMMRPIGAVPVSKLIRSARETPITAIMRSPLTLISPEMDQEEVAHTFQKYHLAAAPVVDEAGRLTGTVTVDDIVDVISEEGEEDLLKLAGVSEAAQTDNVFRSVRSRAPWILVNIATALIASTVISAFSNSITHIVQLAILMPIVASLGGNVGNQTLAVAVRALASRDLTDANAWRYVVREAATGLTQGLMFGAVLAAVAWFWFQSQGLAIAVGLAVVINLALGGIVGIVVPLILRRIGADPAVSSSVFVTFTTDALGFLAFLGLATLILLSP